MIDRPAFREWVAHVERYLVKLGEVWEHTFNNAQEAWVVGMASAFLAAAWGSAVHFDDSVIYLGSFAISGVYYLGKAIWRRFLPRRDDI